MNFDLLKKIILPIIVFGVCIILILSIASHANAKEIIVDEITITPSLEYTDGSPMPVENIARFDIYYTLGDRIENIEQEVIDTFEPVTSVTLDDGNDVNFIVDLTSRVEPYQMYVYAKTVDIYGQQSDFSNGTLKTYFVDDPTKIPSPILDLNFNIRCVDNNDCAIRLIDNNTP